MLRNLGTIKVIWILAALFALSASLVGVFNTDIYSKVIDNDIMPGVFGQDMITIFASVVILLMVLWMKEDDSKKQIVVLGIFGYLFYAYGIYVIERVYNMLYYLYLVIFSLSFWSLIYGVFKIRQDVLLKACVSRPVRYTSAGFSLVVAAVFNVLWIVQLLPLLQAGDKIEFLYSVYILDLCFIMPVFAIIGITTLRNKVMGLVLIPAMFILGFTLIFSLAIAELVKPLYDQSISAGGLIPSLVLSILFLVLAFLHLRNLKFDEA